jgi:hypothetical protein
VVFEKLHLLVTKIVINATIMSFILIFILLLDFLSLIVLSLHLYTYIFSDEETPIVGLFCFLAGYTTFDLSCYFL